MGLQWGATKRDQRNTSHRLTPRGQSMDTSDNFCDAHNARRSATMNLSTENARPAFMLKLNDLKTWNKVEISFFFAASVTCDFRLLSIWILSFYGTRRAARMRSHLDRSVTGSGGAACDRALRAIWSEWSTGEEPGAGPATMQRRPSATRQRVERRWTRVSDWAARASAQTATSWMTTVTVVQVVSWYWTSPELPSWRWRL